MNTNRHPRGEALQAFADAELGEMETATVAEHCAACEACRLEVDRIRGMQALLARDAEAVRPRPAWPAVAARVDRERRPLGLGFVFGTALACAAGLALAVLVGGGSRGLHEQVENPAFDSPWQGGGGGSLLDVFASAIPEES